MITDDLDSSSSFLSKTLERGGEVMIVGCPLPFPLSGFSVTPRKYY